METSKKIHEYFFVAFGRDPDSLQELLELPPNASEKEINDALKTYRLKLKAEKKEKVKQLKEEGCTKEELVKKDRELEDELNETLAEVTEKKKKVTKELTRRKKLRKQGIHEENPIWSEMYSSISEIEDLQTLQWKAINTAIPKLNKQTLNKYKTVPCYDIPFSNSKKKQYHFHTWQQWHIQCKTRLLLKADKLWNNIPYTNRDFWEDRIEQWTDIHQDFIQASLTSKLPARLPKNEYPLLSSATKLSIEKLLKEVPKRADTKKADSPFADLLKILNKIRT